jgi:hypothetical protein
MSYAQTQQPNGWADDRLMEAFDLIGAVRIDAREAGAFALADILAKAEKAVEAADVALEEERAA